MAHEEALAALAQDVPLPFLIAAAVVALLVIATLAATWRDFRRIRQRRKNH